MTASRTAGRIAVLAATAIIGVTATATAAHAVAGIEYVTMASATDSTSPKSLTVYCPAGKAAINGGAYVTGAVGSVRLREIAPATLMGLTWVRVVAEEDPDGYAGTWRVNATAVCVTPPAGLQYVRASATDPGSAWATAACGTKRIIGGGYTSSPTSRALAAGIELDQNRAYVSVEPSSVPPVVQPVTGTAVAVCANTILPRQRLVSVESAMNSTNGKSATAACPAGLTVIGVGGDLYGWRHNLVQDDRTISPTANAVTVTGYEDQFGSADAWAVEAFALCAQ
jgi:hypothetical protein